MTRILVQRGSGSSSSSQPRSSTTSSSSSVSAAPTPPPLPPPYVPPSAFHSPHNLSRSAAASSSSRIWEEVALKDSWDVEPCAVCGEFQSTSSDTNFRFIACHYSDSKVKGRESEGNVQDDGSAEGHTTNEIEGKEQQMTVPVSFIIEEGQQGDIEFPDQGAEVSFSGDCRVASFEFERLRMHEEDLGSQKILVDTVIEQKHEGEEVCLQTGQNRVQSSPVQYCTQCNTQPGNPLCSHQLPRLSQGSSQSQGLGASSMPTFSSALPSLPLPGGSDIGPLRGHEDIDQPRLSSSQKMADTATCSYIPPCALPVPPPPRRGNWVGSSASSGSRAGGSSRRVSRNIKDSRSSPHSSRSTSPRSYGEGDGYNSADEQNPWGSGPSMFEDSDERERQFDMDIRRTKGLEVRRMSEDGNCLFRAVADQVYGDADMHEETRQLCIDYMEKERDHFSQFVTESFTAYCKRKRRDKVYGNNLEIQAMAEMYNRPIHIYSYGTEPINIFQGSYETDLPPIRLSYHRGHHYNSLVDPSRPTIGAGLGFGSLRGANIDRDQVKAALKAQQDQQIEKALLAEGRYYSDLELTEHEMEQMVMEASRAEFLAESHRQQLGWVESSTSARAEPSSSGAIGTSNSHGDILDVSQPQRQGAHNSSPYLGAAADPGLTSNMRTLLSMGFSYLRVLEAYSIFGDDVNDMLCYLLEADTSSPGEGSTHRMKGKAAER